MPFDDRTVKFTLILSEREHCELKRLAELERLTLADTLRQLVRDRLGRLARRGAAKVA